MERVWWEQVTNAGIFIRTVVDTILSEKSMLLVLPDYVPWRQKFQELIEMNVTKQNSKNSFDFIESPKEKVGEFLLYKYCKEEKRIQYRPNKSYACFLAESDDIVMNDRYIWIQNSSNDLLDEWMDFLSDYHRNKRKDASSAVFILEVKDETLLYKAKKGIVKLIYDKEMNFFDTYAFCMLAVSGISVEIYLKSYLAELVYNVCKNDAELCAECIKSAKLFLDDPFRVLSKVKLEKTRSDGSRYHFNESDLNRRVWKTQIKILFPIIEDYRGKFVADYYENISELLPIQSSNGEQFLEPEEVEIGTLHYMVTTELLTVNAKEDHRLCLFKKARNKLAHLKTLDLKEVVEILAD